MNLAPNTKKALCHQFGAIPALTQIDEFAASLLSCNFSRLITITCRGLPPVSKKKAYDITTRTNMLLQILRWHAGNDFNPAHPTSGFALLGILERGARGCPDTHHYLTRGASDQASNGSMAMVERGSVGSWKIDVQDLAALSEDAKLPLLIGFVETLISNSGYVMSCLSHFDEAILCKMPGVTAARFY
jgi:hypothetical protein